MKHAVLVVASVTAWLLSSPLVLGQADTNRISVPFSDPARPGAVRVNLFQGAITVKTWSGSEVVVATTGGQISRREQPAESAGLKRLGPPSGLSTEEENNVVSIAGGRFTDLDVEIQVPARTNLTLRTMSGQVLVEDVDGDIEATSMNGSITLTRVGGAVVAHAMNGKVLAALRQVAPQKPMAFTSLNGTIDVTLPPSVAANLKLRSDRGEVYTDFDVRLQQPAAGPPPIPDPPGKGRSAAASASSSAGGRPRRGADTSIHGSVNGGGPEFELRTFNGNIYLRKGS